MALVVGASWCCVGFHCSFTLHDFGSRTFNSLYFLLLIKNLYLQFYVSKLFLYFIKYLVLLFSTHCHFHFHF